MQYSYLLIMHFLSFSLAYLFYLMDSLLSENTTLPKKTITQSFSVSINIQVVCMAMLLSSTFFVSFFRGQQD